MTSKIAVVTGASSGIGRASARRLAAEGFEVIVAARRTDRIQELAAEIGGRAITCDVTKPADIAALAQAAGPRVEVLVANAGGAIGTETVATANFQEWRTMYDVNVIGAAASIQAFLPALINAHGCVIPIGSVAAIQAYEGGAGYCGVKAAVRSMMQSLRLEVVEQPVRICEIDPGMTKSDEFALVRFHGNAEKADQVYAGVPEPLTQDDIADAVAWIATRPEHVNVDQLVLRPRVQAAAHKVYRV